MDFSESAELKSAKTARFRPAALRELEGLAMKSHGQYDAMELALTVRRKSP